MRDIVCDRIDDSPTFVPEPAGLSGKSHPFRSRPHREIGCANAASLHANAHLAGSWFGPAYHLDTDFTGCRNNSCAHGTDNRGYLVHGIVRAANTHRRVLALTSLWRNWFLG